MSRRSTRLPPKFRPNTGNTRPGRTARCTKTRPGRWTVSRRRRPNPKPATVIHLPDRPRTLPAPAPTSRAVYKKTPLTFLFHSCCHFTDNYALQTNLSTRIT